jgi:hypothetical protein
MIFADVFKYLLLVVGTLIVFVSYWLLAISLFPAMVERSRVAYGHRPIRLTIIGALAALPLLTIGAGLMNGAPNAVLKIVGAALASLPILLGLLGSAGLSERIAHGLMHADDARTPWRRSLRGGLVLSFTFLLPIIGWFIVLPATLLSGLGVMLTAGRTPRGNRPHAPAPIHSAGVASEHVA